MTTVEEIVETMERRYGIANRVWVMDRGMASAENIAWLQELARIRSTDVVLPLADGSSRERRIRCVVRPDKSRALLLDRLDLRLPERLRIPAHVARMQCRLSGLSARNPTITTPQPRKLG